MPQRIVKEKWNFTSDDFISLNKFSGNAFNLKPLKLDSIKLILHDDNETGWIIHKLDSSFINYELTNEYLGIKRYDQSWGFKIKLKTVN